MAAPTYATAVQLAAYLGEDQRVPETMDVARLLRQASRTVDRMVTARYTLDRVTELPTDADYLAALVEATCATVEYWLHAGGEDLDRMVLGGPVNFDGASVGSMPTWQPPRALEVLRQAGLLGQPGAR